jgi:hypothetical protein
MQLPLMDGANNAQKNVKYSYQVAEWVNGKKTGNTIEKYVEPATMFDVNTAIMRCLTKNIALFGLGHYIYAGEDLPVEYETEAQKEGSQQTDKVVERAEELAMVKTQLELQKTKPDLTKYWNQNTQWHNDKQITELFTARRLAIEKKVA